MSRLASMLLVACAGSPDPGPAPRPAVDLIDVTAFVPSTEDPLGHGAVDCPPVGWIIEGATIEVDTGACPLAVLEQPLLADVVPSDTLEAVFWHNQLVAEEASEAHLALLIDGDLIYERFVPIPSDAEAYTELVTGVSAQPGDRLQLHLHNHGTNSWSFLHLERLAEDP